MYEFFFEIFLCVLLHLATAYNHSEPLLLLALFLFVALTSLIIFLFGLFCCSGPYFTPKRYMAGSINRSWWGTRPLVKDSELDLMLKMEKEKERQLR